MNKYFAMVYNPSNHARFALTDGDAGEVVMFDTYDQAEDAASRTLFGAHGYYEIYQTDEELERVVAEQSAKHEAIVEALRERINAMLDRELC